MTTYLVKQGQSLIDVACELYGAAEMVVKLAADNGLGITDELPGKYSLSYDETVTALLDTATWFRLNKLHVVASDLDGDDNLIEHSAQEHTAPEHN